MVIRRFLIIFAAGMVLGSILWVGIAVTFAEPHARRWVFGSPVFSVFTPVIMPLAIAILSTLVRPELLAGFTLAMRRIAFGMLAFLAGIAVIQVWNDAMT